MGPKKAVPSPKKNSNKSNAKVAEFNFNHNNVTNKRLRSDNSSKGSENSFNGELSQSKNQSSSGNERIMKFLGEKIDKLAEDVNNSLAKLSENITAQQRDINQLKSDVANNTKSNIGLSTRFENIVVQSESIEKELKRINLIITGLNDPINESNESLKQVVEELCSRVSKSEIKVDIVTRIGNHSALKPRQIIVRFYCLSDRELVWASRKSTVPPIFINEDLPFTLRRDFAILRKKAKDLRRENEDAEINWRKKTITTESDVLIVKNGNLVSNGQYDGQSSQKGGKDVNLNSHDRGIAILVKDNLKVKEISNNVENSVNVEHFTIQTTTSLKIYLMNIAD
ncbi:hypothetical protein Fcan01_26892 [Folsomia candida]|uniref:Uncharacterized protein n=1 Tax=Folsomia candida TaxID=158441 RepID=A0A226D111_FOLCA|nr:hypothetical protein Fcan01_26892 [Folsomia candida]